MDGTRVTVTTSWEADNALIKERLAINDPDNGIERNLRRWTDQGESPTLALLGSNNVMASELLQDLSQKMVGNAQILSYGSLENRGHIGVRCQVDDRLHPVITCPAEYDFYSSPRYYRLSDLNVRSLQLPTLYASGLN